MTWMSSFEPALHGARCSTAPGHPRRCSRQSCDDSQLLLASLEGGWILGSHPEVGARSGVYPFRATPCASTIVTAEMAREAMCKRSAFLVLLRIASSTRTLRRASRSGAFASEFAAVTDVPLVAENERHCFVRDTLRDAGIEPVGMDHFATWVPKVEADHPVTGVIRIGEQKSRTRPAYRAGSIRKREPRAWHRPASGPR